MWSPVGTAEGHALGQRRALFGEPRGTTAAAHGKSRVHRLGQMEGGELRGSIEYVKIYAKVLPTTEIVKRAYGIGQESSEKTRPAEFDFADGLQGWQPQRGRRAGIIIPASSQKVRPEGDSSPRRPSGPGGKEGLSAALRMALDRGSRGELIFVTTEGAGRVPFPTRADRKLHTYVFEPWTWAGWGGTLLALGLVPSELPGSAAAVTYLRLMEQPGPSPNWKSRPCSPSRRCRGPSARRRWWFAWSMRAERPRAPRPRSLCPRA